MATLILAVGVEFCLSKVKLCRFHFFAVDLIIWCENGCLPPTFFLPHCNVFRPHPYLSIVATVMVAVTCRWCCLNRLCHTAGFAVAGWKADGWPARLDFQTFEGSGSGETLTCG